MAKPGPNKARRTSKQPKAFQRAFLHPKYWGIWLGIGLLKTCGLLPYAFKFKVGKVLGKGLFYIATKRRRLALANIQLCFPEKTSQQQQAILKSHFESLGIGLMEMAIVWWGDHKKNHAQAREREMVDFIGEAHLRQAQQQGKGVLILAPHFTTLEVTGLFVSFLTNYHAVYRPHDNPLMDYLIAKGRSIEFSDGQKVEPVSNGNTRLMLKVLRAGESMTFLPDQRYRSKGHVVVDFFGQPTRSNPATSKIAKLTGCAVVPTFTRRLPDNRYEVEFLPALKDFPSGDDTADTLRLHHLYEAEIRRNPSQYLWVHNRWNLKKY
jgi:KDO2-lipid IV(A) lauroyltransferase